MPTEKIELNKELVEKLEKEFKTCKENGQFVTAVEICERLVFEFDYFGYRFELPELYNKAGLYSKTKDYVNAWMLDNEIGDLLSIDPRPILFLGDAYAKQHSYDIAINNYGLVIKLVSDTIQNYPNAVDINDKKLMIAIAKTRIGEIYYKENNFLEARNHFQLACQSAPYIVALYYIAHMCYKGQSFEKDIEVAISIYCDFADVGLGTDEEFNNCIKKANYELGMIYATERGYKDKEKAIFRLNRAKDLGYIITDSEINSIIENITDDGLINNNSYSSNNSAIALNVLIIISIAVGVISIFAGLPVLFWICVLLLIVFLIAKKFTIN